MEAQKSKAQIKKKQQIEISKLIQIAYELAGRKSPSMQAIDYYVHLLSQCGYEEVVDAFQTYISGMQVGDMGIMPVPAPGEILSIIRKTRQDLRDKSKQKPLDIIKGELAKKRGEENEVFEEENR